MDADFHPLKSFVRAATFKMSYEDYVSEKLVRVMPTGFEPPPLHDGLFPHQEALVNWALRRGRCAVFADTGLGKTRIQLEWAIRVHEHTGGNVIILAPLAVAQQTSNEAKELGISVTVCRDQSDVKPGVNITNYERLHRFSPSSFSAVVLDESSCIKHHDTHTLKVLLEAFANTPFKLCATATPAPNDWAELGTHAEFLGICSRTEMLSEFFVHDGGETQTWRLKGHAKSEFWRWVSSWAALVRNPSDLGFDGSKYVLPALVVDEHIVDASHDDAHEVGMLFAVQASTLQERRNARRASIQKRAAICADMVNSSDAPWVIWCDLNAEADALKDMIPDAVEVRGPDTIEDKEKRLEEFANGSIRVLITKPSIAGFGLNWQHCSNMAFVGVTDSFESYYQAVRRCWRFGQKNTVHVHICASELEGAVLSNLRRKEEDAKAMADSLSRETMDEIKRAVIGQNRTVNEYQPTTKQTIPEWLTSEY